MRHLTRLYGDDTFVTAKSQELKNGAQIYEEIRKLVWKAYCTEAYVYLADRHPCGMDTGTACRSGSDEEDFSVMEGQHEKNNEIRR